MTPSDYQDRIVTLLDINRAKEALAEALRAQQEFPEMVYFKYLQGIILNQLGELYESQAILKECIQLDPEYARPFLELAYSTFINGNKNEAEEYIEQFLQLDPQNAKGHAVAALIYADEYSSQSKKHLSTAKQLDPIEPMILEAEKYISRLGLNFRKIQELTKQDLSENPESRDAAMQMGISELTKANFDQAESLLRQAYIHNPHAELLNAWIDSRLGKFFPFRLTFPFQAYTYFYSIILQLVGFCFWILAAYAGMRYSSLGEYWMPVGFGIHMIASLYFFYTYVVKYVAQFIYGLKHHSEVNIFNRHNGLRLCLLFAAICYLLLVFTNQISFFLASIFFLLYVPLGGLFLNRKTLTTKIIAYIITAVIAVSLIYTVSINLMGGEVVKLLTAPGLLGWAVFLLLNQALSEWETKLNNRNRT